MTKKEFQDGMNSIQVDCEKKEKLLGQLYEKQLQKPDGLSGKQPFYMRKGSSKISFWKMGVPVVAVLLACAILVPGVAYADEILDYFRGNLSQSDELADNVSKSIFQDKDKHVSMEVCELLSDGYATCMTVKYTALDKKGREWLFGDKSKDILPADCLATEGDLYYADALNLEPLEEEGDLPLHATGFLGSGLEDVKEQTETSRVFSLDYSVDGFTNRCRLTYPMLEEEEKTVDLDIRNLLPIYTYILTGECSSDNYAPVYLRLSKIKYMIYGKNKRKGYGTSALVDEDIDSAALYFKSSAPINLIGNDPGHFFMGALDPDAFYNNMDLCVLTGEFYGPLESAPYVDEKGEKWIKRTFHRLAVDPEDVEKIELNKDVYTLSRVE